MRLAITALTVALLSVCLSAAPAAGTEAELVVPWTAELSPESWDVPLAVGGPGPGGEAAYLTEHRVLAPEALELELPLGPFGITRDGATLWVGLFEVGRLLRVDLAAETATAYPLPEGMTPFLLTMGPHGGLWFTDYDYGVAPGQGHVVHFDPDSAVLTAYPVPLEDAGPAGLAFDAAGRLWFANFIGFAVASLELEPGNGHGSGMPPARVTLYPLPETDEQRLLGPLTLLLDATAGTVWSAPGYEPHLFRLDPATGEHRGVELPEAFRSKVGLARAPDGSFWTGQHGGDRLLAVTTEGEVVGELATAAPPRELHPISAINQLAFDDAGHLWFAQHFSNRIGRLDPATGTVMEYEVGREPLIQWLVLDEGAVWFAAMGEDTLVRVEADRAPHLEVQLAELPGEAAAGSAVTFDLLASWQGGPPAAGELEAYLQLPAGITLVEAEALTPPAGVDQAFRIGLAVDAGAAARTVVFPAGVRGDDFLAVNTAMLTVLPAGTDPTGDLAWLLPAALALLLTAGAAASFIVARRLLRDGA